MKSKDNFKTLFPFILAAVLGLGVVLIYLPVLLNLVNRLAGDEDYSYGLLLPLVSAYIVYLKWPQIRRYRWEPSWWGVPVVILGFILLTAGKLVADPYLPAIFFHRGYHRLSLTPGRLGHRSDVKFSLASPDFDVAPPRYDNQLFDFPLTINLFPARGRVFTGSGHPPGSPRQCS